MLTGVRFDSCAEDRDRKARCLLKTNWTLAIFKALPTYADLPSVSCSTVCAEDVQMETN